MKKYYILLSILLLTGAVAQNVLIAEEEKAPFADTTISVTAASDDSSDDSDKAATVATSEDEDKSDEAKEEAKSDEKKDEEKEEAKEEKSEATQYTVVSGDCLSAIAGRFLGDMSRWPELVEANKDRYPSLQSNPNLIYPGWSFVVPGADNDAIAQANKSGASSSSSGSYTTGSTTKSSIVGTAQDPSGWGSVNPCENMPGYLSSDYGYRTHPVTGQPSTFHSGVDIPVCSGTRLNALANGTVIACGWENGGGNYVSIRYDNGMESFYCHLQSSTVKVGQRVECGQQVALSDNTGAYTTGAHLHMGIKKDGQYVDPKQYLNLPSAR